MNVLYSGADHLIQYHALLFEPFSMRVLLRDLPSGLGLELGLASGLGSMLGIRLGSGYGLQGMGFRVRVRVWVRVRAGLRVRVQVRVSRVVPGLPFNVFNLLAAE